MVHCLLLLHDPVFDRCRRAGVDFSARRQMPFPHFTKCFVLELDFSPGIKANVS